MKKFVFIPIVLSFFLGFSQNTSTDSTTGYKKRVLETSEVDFLTSYYSQDGDNASVTGGIGTEKLTDFTPTVVVSVPLNDDDILTIDAGISTYTSASSSNLNPFDSRTGGNSKTTVSGASQSYVIPSSSGYSGPIGSPWVASSGASRSDTWAGGTISYAHSSDSRNTIWDADISVANEYDYSSLGFGGGLTQLFNDKNTTLGLSAKVYLDSWNPRYPTELDSYVEANNNLNSGFFNGVYIWDKYGLVSKDWHPVSGFQLINDKSRNSYSLSLSLSQILSKNAQIQFILDLVKQQGWLANPMQRVYFGDIPNYYIGNPESIPNYTSPTNKDVFQLADDFERLPHTRFKVPIGLRFNYFINDMFSCKNLLSLLF